MVKNSNSKELRKVLNSKIGKTFKNNFFQYLAVILITGIAMTLFLGLKSSSLSFENRVNNLYETGNIADIWTNVTYHDEEDLNNINNLFQGDVVVEDRLTVSSKINGWNSNALIYNEYPTVSKPSKTDNNEDEFFIIDEDMWNKGLKDNSSDWANEDGNYGKVDVSISLQYASVALNTIDNYINDMFKDDNSSNSNDIINDFLIENYEWFIQSFPEIDTLEELEKIYSTIPSTEHLIDQLTTGYSDFFESILAPSSTTYTPVNFLNNTYFDFQYQITGTMLFPENIQKGNEVPPNFLMSQSIFDKSLNEQFDKNYNLELNDEITCEDIINKFLFDTYKNSINNNAYETNQYLSKISNDLNIHECEKTINDYFANKEDNNLLLSMTIDNFPSNIVIQNDIIQSRQFTLVFPFIFFFVAILVVLTTTSQIILKERTQIGTMKAIGINKKTIILHYMKLTLFVVSIGCLLGIILGPTIIPNIMNIKYNILYTLPSASFTFPFIYTILALLFTAISVCLVTYLIIYKEASSNPVVSMRAKETKELKVKKYKDKHSSGLSLSMAIRNIRLSITRSIMVIIGIAGCTSLLVCGFGTNDTIYHGIDIEFSTVMNCDAVAYYSIQSGESLKNDFENIDGIDEVEEYTYLPTTVHNDDFMSTFVYALCDNYQFFNTGEDNYIVKGDVLITQKIARVMNLKVGDNFDFTVLGKKYEGTVGYILDTFYNHGIFINTSYNNYSSIGELKNAAWLNFDQGSDSASIKDEIMGTSNESSTNEIKGVTSILLTDEAQTNIEEIMSSVSTMINAILIFAIMLAIVVLYNLSLLNFKERIREIATLKVLGFSKFQIGLSLFYEIIILTIIGIGAGLLLGLPMEMLILSVNQTAMIEFIYYINLSSYAYSFAITIMTAFIVNFFIGRSIKKVKMVESLKSIE